MNVTIEKRGPENIDDLFVLIEACGEDMWRRLGLDHWKPPVPKEIYREYARTKSVFAVYDGVDLAGTFTIGPDALEAYLPGCWADDTHRAVYLSKLAVLPGLQGRGIGRWCMGRVDELAREYGAHAVRFDALTRNAPLLAFYDRTGYRRRGDMYVYDEIGRGWDIVLYEKVL